MEEESGALEVDDAGAESSDSPPEVSTLLWKKFFLLG